MIAATVEAAQAAQQNWQAIVIGAGPAGSVTAIGLARCGVRTLLVDRSQQPRAKVCGGCLNATAVAKLQALGIGDRLAALGGWDLDRFLVAASRRNRAEVRLPAGHAVSRRALDAMLVEAAIAAGADFLPAMRARICPSNRDEGERTVQGECEGRQWTLRAETLVMATGLTADAQLDDPQLDVRVLADSRIGAGATFVDSGSDYEPGTIFMAVGRGGYVGVTRIEDGQLNLAAALDVASVRRASLPEVCAGILAGAGFSVPPQMSDARWRGTVALTRQAARPAAHRLFMVGDAAGYVEPFTGEGMTWGIRAAQAVIPLVQQGIADWNPGLADEWSRTLARQVTTRQRTCRLLSRTLRHPWLARAAIRTVATLPGLGRFAVRRMNRDLGPVELPQAAAGESRLAIPGGRTT